MIDIIKLLWYNIGVVKGEEIMTTKELIKKLQELDPNGNMEIVLDDGWDDSFTSVYVVRNCIQLGYEEKED